ncbi:MAG TPA: biotin/lipoyl-containing protein, partial [Planctomycetaceae bacterium]|nr:biotin/lipoyl-containing protein [Planctomycetaceae bacterium]
MPVELKIPSVGESITEVVVGAWRKSVGDAVEQDEDVVELETDKATFDLPAPAAGVITQILKKSGEAAAVGDVIGYVGEAGEREVPAQKPEAAPAAEPAARASPQPAESKPAAASGASAQAGKKPTAGPAQTPPPRSDKAGDRKAEAAAAPPARAAGASKTEAPPQEKKPPA